MRLPQSSDTLRGLTKMQTGDAVKAGLTLREMLVSACQALGHSPDESVQALKYLEAEWLSEPAALAALSQEGWQELRLPLGLKDELRKQLGGFRGELKGLQPANPPRPEPKHVGLGHETLEPQLHLKASSPSVSRSRGVSIRPEVADLVVQARREFHKNGATTGHLARKLRDKRLAVDGAPFNVTRDTIPIVLREIGLELTPAQTGALWEAMDADGAGKISLNEFRLFFGLNERRQRAVRVLFGFLNTIGTGKITLADWRLRCDPTAQEARGRERPQDEVLLSHLEHLRQLCGGNQQVTVLYEDFERYYTKMSSNIESDVAFEEVLQRAWGLPETWLRADPWMFRNGHTPGAFAPPPSEALKGTIRPPPKSGEGLLRRLRAALGAGRRGSIEPYGGTLFRLFNPMRRVQDNPQAVMAKELTWRSGAEWQNHSQPPLGKVGPAAAVPRADFEAMLREILPTADAQDIASLFVLFQAPEIGEGMVDYSHFLDQIRKDAPKARQDAAKKLFYDIAGPAATELDLSSCTEQCTVPAGVRAAFGHQALVPLQEWLDFHDVVAVTGSESSDTVFEAQLRQAWGLTGLAAARSRPSAGYYRGQSSIQLG